MSRVIFFTVFLTLCMAYAGVLGQIGCYKCNSYSDRDHTACFDPMSPYPYVNYTTCPRNYVCTRVSYITRKQYVVSRGCDPAGNTCNNIYNTLRSYYPDISSFNCYFCTVNYCNSASGLRVQGPYRAIESINDSEPAHPKEA